MTYKAVKPDKQFGAWVIIAPDGAKVIALPYDMPELVARAIAAAFTAELQRAAERQDKFS